MNQDIFTIHPRMNAKNATHQNFLLYTMDLKDVKVIMMDSVTDIPHIVEI